MAVRVGSLALLVALAAAACGGAPDQGEARPEVQARTDEAPGTADAGAGAGPARSVRGTECPLEGGTVAAGGVEPEALTCRAMGDGKLVWVGANGQPGPDAPTGGTGVAGDGGSTGAEHPVARAVTGNGRDCDAASTVSSYQKALVDPVTVAYVYPLGAMTTSHVTPVDHVYVYYPRDAVAAGTYLVSSPADGRVVAVEDFQRTNQYPYPDHRIVIEHACDLYTVLIHVGPLQGRLAAAMADGSLGAPLAVAGGEVLADDSAQPGFDLSSFSAASAVRLANPASYAQAESWKPYTTDPLALFPAELRAAYEAKSLRTEAPFGGTIEWDAPGTARGVWFVAGTNGYRGVGDQRASFDNHGEVAHGYWDTHLAIAPDPVDDGTIVFSVGDWNGCPCQFVSAANDVDPLRVTPGQPPTVVELTKFEKVTAEGGPVDPVNPPRGYRLRSAGPVVGVLALQVNADGTMTVEKLPGATAAQFSGFGPNALTYVR